jgi:hypothetical protein
VCRENLACSSLRLVSRAGREEERENGKEGWREQTSSSSLPLRARAEGVKGGV